MERFLTIKFGSDDAAPRRVKASWGGLTSGAVVNVQLDGGSHTDRWVPCRIERWDGGALLVSKA